MKLIDYTNSRFIIIVTINNCVLQSHYTCWSYNIDRNVLILKNKNNDVTFIIGFGNIEQIEIKNYETK